MKIVLTPVPAGDPVTLGDDSAGDLIVDPPPMPVERRRAQVEDLAFGDVAFATGRGNRLMNFSWVVQRKLADQDTADAFCWTHASSVPINCAIEVTDNGGGSFNFSSAVVTEVAIVGRNGVSIKTRYTVEGAVPSE